MHQDSNSHTTLSGSKSAALQHKPGPNIRTADNRSRTTTPLAHAAAPQPASAAGHQWDEAAEGWNRHGPLVAEWPRDATSAMLDAARIGPGSRVLDIATGAGDQTLDVARRVGTSGQVMATDISPR